MEDITTYTLNGVLRIIDFASYNPTDVIVYIIDFITLSGSLYLSGYPIS